MTYIIRERPERTSACPRLAVQGAGRGGPASRAGFTFIEVICILLIVTIGLAGVIGLVSYGQIIAKKSQGTCTGMITAVSIACDPQPLLSPEMQTSWSYAPYDLDAAGQITNVAEGFVNGYYVKRTETTGVDDIIARDAGSGHVHARSVCVSVDVTDTLKGSLVTSYVTRFVRQRGAP